MSSGLIRIPAASLATYTVTQANGCKLLPKALTGTSDYFLPLRLRADADYAESLTLISNVGLTVYGPWVLAGHRGIAGEGPQNTLWNARRCAAMGMAIEGDIAVTSDGQLRVFHDTTVDALTNGTGTFTSLTAAYVDGLTFLSTVGTELANERIPSFANWLAVGKSAGVEMWPEFKSLRPGSETTDIRAMIDAVVAAGVVSQVTFHSFTLSDLQAARAYHATIKLVMLGNSALDVSTNLAAVTALGFSGFSVDQAAIDAALVSSVSGMVIPLSAYTIDAYSQIFPLAILGVNRFICDQAIFL